MTEEKRFTPESAPTLTETVLANVRRLRVDRGMTWAELTRLSGVSRERIVRPTPRLLITEALVTLPDALGVSWRELLSVGESAR